MIFNKPVQFERLALIGFSCCGKTTLGTYFAELINYQFIDSDQMIEKQSHLSIQDIFKQFGEAHFRELEFQWLQELHQYSNVVISTGGGLPCSQEAIQLLNQHTLTVYLKLDFESLYKRLIQTQDRPLAQKLTRDELYQLYLSRLFFYEQAQICLEANQEIRELAHQLLNLTNLKSA